LVSIQFHGGIGRIALSDLPPELQKRFNYAPVKAKAAALPVATNTPSASETSSTNADWIYDDVSKGVQHWLEPQSVAPAIVTTTTTEVTSMTSLDKKNGFRGYQLGITLASIDPNTLSGYPSFSNADDDNYSVKRFDPTIGSARLNTIVLVFNQGLLNRIVLDCNGNQNFVGLKETFIVAYGQPKAGSIFKDTDLVWEGSHTKLELEIMPGSDYVTATFTNKAVQEKVDDLTKQKAQAAAASAAKNL